MADSDYQMARTETENYDSDRRIYRGTNPPTGILASSCRDLIRKLARQMDCTRIVGWDGRVREILRPDKEEGE